SNDALAREIQSDPAFQGPNGFDRNRFNQIMFSNGLNEHLYVAERRGQERRQQIAASVAADVTVPDAYRQALHRLQSEARSIAYVAIDAEKAGITVEEPTDEDLQAHYDATKGDWRAPEYRKLDLLV